VGDMNGDGLEDFIVGGAHNNQTGIYYQTQNGFEKQEIYDIAKDSELEDLGSLIFDADNDGDNDIYMVSGGNEFGYDSDLLQDRLYVNDGKGNFSKSNNALPEMITSGSRVFSMDYDKDGDLDLFVGGRLVPGNYPLPANSYILENVSTKKDPKFIDVTKKIAPELEDLGFFKNNKGTFENVTNNMNLEDSTGWWFSIKEGDFDEDGDMDFIVGNLGLNYKYKANSEETFDVYFNDFDKNESNDIVLSYFDEGEKFPVRGRECSSQQIPAIKKKFENYESFSNATLVDIYTEQDLEKSLHYQVKSFASIYLENKDGTFIIHKLPNLAQVSNINQIIVKDFNKDSHLDFAIAGNLYGSEVETPRNDAGIGLLLNGDGKGNFEVIEGVESGLFIPGDVKDMENIKINNFEYILAAKNDDYIQFIRVN
jgi:hypothetical protein